MSIKKISWWLLPLGFALSACPYESGVPLAAGPSEPVDTSLYGYWYGIIKDGSDFWGIEALEVSPRSDSLYAITRYGKGIKGDIILPDTAYYTGFITYINGQRFMNVEGSVTITVPRHKKEPEIRVQKIYYIGFMEKRHDTLSVKMITEGFTPTRRALNNPQALLQVVTESLSQQQNIYDEMYTLSYRKISKPKQFYPSR